MRKDVPSLLLQFGTPIAPPCSATRVAGATQAAALEKARAGEGRDVEHVALQTPASEVLRPGRRPRNARSVPGAAAAAAAQVPDAVAGDGSGGRQRGRETREGQGSPASSGPCGGGRRCGGQRDRRTAAASQAEARGGGAAAGWQARRAHVTTQQT